MSEVQWKLMEAEEMEGWVEQFCQEQDIEITTKELGSCLIQLDALQSSKERPPTMEELVRVINVIRGGLGVGGTCEKPCESSEQSLEQGLTPSLIHESLMNRGRGRPSIETLESLRNEYTRVLIENDYMRQFFKELRSVVTRYEKGLDLNSN